MSLVKVKTKYQITLPHSVRQEAGVTVGDLLEVKIERGKITLTPKTVIDRRIAEGLEDIRAGRVYGPFRSPEELIRSLHRNARKLGKKSRSTK